jgi:hypothetical protein
MRSQASMSRYLGGKQEMPVDLANAVSEYISIFDPDEPGAADDGDATEGAAEEPAREFDGLVRGLTDEPLLGPRQGALVDALTTRLREGPPMSSDDTAALTAGMRILGLDG